MMFVAYSQQVVPLLKTLNSSLRPMEEEKSNRIRHCHSMHGSSEATEWSISYKLSSEDQRKGDTSVFLSLSFASCVQSLMLCTLQLGGLNSLLSVERTPAFTVISKVPTIILGMDVSHGSPGQSDVPSIAAVIYITQILFLYIVFCFIVSAFWYWYLLVLFIWF